MQNLVFQELGENFVKSNTLTIFFAFGIPFIIFPAIYVKSFHEIFATQDTSEMTIEIDPLPSRKIETFYEILTKLVSPGLSQSPVCYCRLSWSSAFNFSNFLTFDQEKSGNLIGQVAWDWAKFDNYWVILGITLLWKVWLVQICLNLLWLRFDFLHTVALILDL